MTDNLDRVETILRSSEALDRATLDDLVADLAGLPEQESRTLLRDVAKDLEARAVPLLEAVAMATTGSLASTATQLLGRMRDQSAASALQRIAASASSGDIRKAARRGLHALASLGIRPAPVAAAAPARPKVSRPLQQVLSSPIDGLGDRALWMVFGTGADIEVLSLTLNEEKGIVDAYSGELPRSRFDRNAAKLLSDEKFPWVEIPVDYGRHLVEEAHAKNAATGTPLPLDYLAWRERIGRPEQAYAEPLVYSVINAAEVRWDPRYLDRSGQLLESPLFQGWLFNTEELADFLREMETARESGLVLAGVDPEARERMAVDRAIHALFDARRRALYKRRLEETAYLLWKLGRSEQARMALAAAMGLEPPDRPLLNHPFIRSLIQWNLEVMEATVRGERTREIKPGVRLHLPY